MRCYARTCTCNVDSKCGADINLALCPLYKDNPLSRAFNEIQVKGTIKERGDTMSQIVTDYLKQKGESLCSIE